MTDKPTIKESVLARIKRGEVAMHSRAYFATQVVAVAALIVVAILLAVFVASFAFFSVHESGEQFLLGFGARGLATFLGLFPWLTFVLLIALLLAIELLLRRFKFGYRTPILVAFVAIAVGAIGIGLVVSLTPFHSNLLERADRGALPIVGPLYEGIHTSHPEAGVFRGVVTSVEDDQFTITHDDSDQDTDDGTWVVLTPPDFDTSALTVGERVFVAGSAGANGAIEAYGVERYDR